LGGAGDDTLFGGETGESETAADTLTGGPGADIFQLSSSTDFLLEPEFPPKPEPSGDIITDYEDNTDRLEYEFAAGVVDLDELTITGDGTSQVTIKVRNEGVPGEIPDYLETVAVLNGLGGSVITLTESDFF
jgi:hypothetical protein